VEKVEEPAALLQLGVLMDPSFTQIYLSCTSPFYSPERCMHKDELINLHQMLSDVKDYFEEINPELKFSQYTALKITPSQQHKSKMEHKYAIFVLGTEIANAMKEVDYSSSSRISARMKELADKTLKEMEYP
jgi:hypothetical protein